MPHSAKGLANIELAVHTARKAGVPGQSVLNTRSLDSLLADA